MGTRKCYYPDGTEAPGDAPCSNAEHTPCCGASDVCLSNGFCIPAGHQPYVLSRGSCTDPEWGNHCAPECRDNNPGGGTWFSVLDPDSDGNVYCCGGPIVDDNGDVACSGKMFSVSDAAIVPGFALLQNVSSLDAPTTTTSSSSSTPGPSATSNGSQPLNSPSATSCPSTPSWKSNTAVGAGVGIPLGVMALAFLAWAIYERLRNRKLLQSMQVRQVHLEPMYPQSMPSPSPSQQQQQQRFHDSVYYQGVPPKPIGELGNTSRQISEIGGGRW